MFFNKTITFVNAQLLNTNFVLKNRVKTFIIKISGTYIKNESESKISIVYQKAFLLSLHWIECEFTSLKRSFCSNKNGFKR